jgi:hypothetical protein
LVESGVVWGEREDRGGRGDEWRCTLILSVFYNHRKFYYVRNLNSRYRSRTQQKTIVSDLEK